MWCPHSNSWAGHNNKLTDSCKNLRVSEEICFEEYESWLIFTNIMLKKVITTTIPTIRITCKSEEDISNYTNESQTNNKRSMDLLKFASMNHIV